MGSLVLGSSANAQIMGLSSRQLPKGSLKLLAYYQGTMDQDLNFNVQNAGNCTTANGVKFACGQSGDVNASGTGGMGVVKVLFQPWELVQYYALGGVGDYALRAPVNGIGNTFDGDNPGFMLGGGMRVVVLPDTQVTPGIAVDAGASQSAYKFNRLAPGSGLAGASGQINQRLGLTQWQVALQIGHLFTITEPQTAVDKEKEILLPEGLKVEPYGGVKWTRIQADLNDLQSGSHAGGQQDAISPFVGVRLPLYGHEGLFAEAAFAHGTQVAGGLEIRFK